MQYVLDDFGNFENLVKIWTCGPPNYYQNCSKRVQEKYGNILENVKFVNMGLKLNKNRTCVYPRYHFLFLKNRVHIVYKIFSILIYILHKVLLRRWGSEMISSIKTFTKAWICIAYLSKTWNGNLINPANLSIFKEGNHRTLISR